MSATGCRDENLPVSVSLDCLIDAVEAQSGTVSSYLDRRTGEVVAISEEAFQFADEDTAASDTIPEWQQEEVECARRISAGDGYVALPTSWDVHEWNILKQFCYSLADDRLCAEFLLVIHVCGSFRSFKNRLTHRGLWDSWSQFRRLALREQLIQ